MKKMIGCRKVQKIKQLNNDQNLERHLAECAECQKSLEVLDWMQEFAGQTPLPQNLPAPGFLLFKARLIEKQSAAARAVQPIIRMQFASVVIFAVAIGWLLLKSERLTGLLLRETFSLLLSVAPLLILAVLSAILICFAFAYFLRETTEFKK